jgi:superfamily I DNA/RNA helicase
MARMIPSQPVGKVSPEVATVFRRLKQIPGEDCVCWLSLPMSDDVRPEFLVIYQQRNAFVLSVSSLSAEAAESVVQGGLFAREEELTPASFGLREMSVLDQFSRDVARELGLSDEPVDSLDRAILFPNVPQATLDRIRQIRPSDGFQFWGKERLSSAALQESLSREAEREDPSAPLIQILRQRFSPEIRIPSAMVGRLKTKRDLAAGLTKDLLDLDQEMVVKLDLALSPDAEEAVSAIRTRLVTGVAGSGKSLVLLYRAMVLARFHPKSRLLILTHNRPLNGDLRDRFMRICDGASTEWGTFYQWCHRHMGPHWRDLVNGSERRDKVLRIMRVDTFRKAALSGDFLLEEIDWIKDQGITNLRDYLDTPRAGRGQALQEGQRREVFRVFKEYQEWLLQRGQDDWSNIPLRFLRLLDEGQLKLPPYDFVFIDEAQFFAPVWFEIVKRAVRPDGGQLFMAADPTQGFLKRRVSWAGSGLDVRGRSMKLQHSYRNSRQILAFATRFYRSRLPEDDEEINLPGAGDWDHLPAGPEPRFIRLDAAQDVITRTANEVLKGIEGGFPAGRVLVLAADGSMTEPLIQAINRNANHAINVQETFDSDKVKICSLNAGTGLEAPVVFLVGLDTLFEREEDFGLSPGEREERMRDNTRRIYMGMTRASQLLVIVLRNEKTRLALEGCSSSTSCRS